MTDVRALVNLAIAGTLDPLFDYADQHPPTVEAARRVMTGHGVSVDPTVEEAEAMVDDVTETDPVRALAAIHLWHNSLEDLRPPDYPDRFTKWAWASTDAIIEVSIQMSRSEWRQR